MSAVMNSNNDRYFFVQNEHPFLSIYNSVKAKAEGRNHAPLKGFVLYISGIEVCRVNSRAVIADFKVKVSTA